MIALNSNYLNAIYLQEKHELQNRIKRSNKLAIKPNQKKKNSQIHHLNSSRIHKKNSTQKYCKAKTKQKSQLIAIPLDSILFRSA